MKDEHGDGHGRGHEHEHEHEYEHEHEHEHESEYENEKPLSPDERREILELLQQSARGERPSAGRDEVPEQKRLELGGMRGRALACRASVRDHDAGAFRLAAGDGEIAIRMTPKGEFIYPYGDLIIETPDRGPGAAFVEAMAGWLGTPLDPRGTIEPGEAAISIRGSYVKLGVRDDADGVRWDVFKLLLEGHHPAEVFLRVSTDLTRAAFTEKWSRYRESLLMCFEHRLGAGRAIAQRTLVDVFEGAWLTVPPDWVVTRQAGHIRATDPADEAAFEVSYQPFPLHPRLPRLSERLRAALSSLEGQQDAAAARAVAVDRGDLELVWTEYEYESDDTKTGLRRLARGRILIAANDALQVLVTFCYWPADEGWAVPAWETIISTLRLAGGGPELVPDSSVSRVDAT
jgi:hypothetical protein